MRHYWTVHIPWIGAALIYAIAGWLPATLVAVYVGIVWVYTRCLNRENPPILILFTLFGGAMVLLVTAVTVAPWNFLMMVLWIMVTGSLWGYLYERARWKGLWS